MVVKGVAVRECTIETGATPLLGVTATEVAHSASDVHRRPSCARGAPKTNEGMHVFAAVRQALHLIGREFRLRWVLLILLSLVASGFEMTGAALIYVLLAIVADPGGKIDLPLVGDLRDWFTGVDDETLLLGLAATMALFFVVRGVVHVGETYLQNRVAHNAGARLASRLMGGYLAMPYAFHLRRNSAGLIRNANEAVNELVSGVFLPVIRVTAEAVMVAAMLALLVSIAPLATGIAIVVVGSAALILLRIVQPMLKRLGETAHRLRRETLRTIQQSMHGVRDIKILGRERAFARTYRKGKLGLARAKYLRSTATDLPRIIIETALIFFILAFLTVAVIIQTGAGSILSVLGLFAYAGLRLQPSLQRIIAGLNNLKFASAPLEDLEADLRMIEVHAGSCADVEPIPFERDWRAERVVLQYEGSDIDALKGVDLTIDPGEVIGICGPSGGGKTTLVDVLTGLLEPTAGRVTVDGRDLREHARGWHRNLGVVPQMVFLTDDTLRRNIALGVPDNEVDEEAIKDAVHLAQLDTFVASLPNGLDTVVGERGTRVSGGQRQRVAIARALYRHPEVLIFDEGTSALDTVTEGELLGALERLRGDHTIVMIAHRLSTVRNCDRVVYLENGQIAGLGTYDALLAQNPAFKRMVVG